MRRFLKGRTSSYTGDRRVPAIASKGSATIVKQCRMGTNAIG